MGSGLGLHMDQNIRACLEGQSAAPFTSEVSTGTVRYVVPPSQPSKRPTMVKIRPILFYQLSSPTCTVSHQYSEKKQQGTDTYGSLGI